MCDRRNPECKTEDNVRTIIGGYWVWWCTTHNQPLEWCATDFQIKQKEALIMKQKEADNAFKIAYSEAVLTGNITAITLWAKKYVIPNANSS